MANGRTELALTLVLVTALVGRATAQSGCNSVLMNLAPCLNYITGNSSVPSSGCCSQLSSVVQSSPACLCSVANGATASLGIAINRTLALSLPGACKITTPPLTQCQAANAPTASTSPPERSPADSPIEPGSTPSDSSEHVPSLENGTKSVPSTDANSGSIKASMNAALFLFFVLSCSSTIVTF